MNEDAFRVMDLAMKGFQCSQILMVLALDALGKKNEDLVRAMSGLLGGMGCGKTCGVMTGGCCVLGLHAGSGTPNGIADERLGGMLTEFVEWFESEYKTRYGSIECDGIVQGDMRNRMARCPGIIVESLAQLKEILAENNHEFESPNPTA